MTIISEIGHGFDKFSTSKEFTSYLRLAPNNKISGGKKLSGRTPKGSNALGIAFRNAANTISRQRSGALKSFFKRKAYQKGRGVAITATARKLSTIVWNMITYAKEYVPMDETLYDDKIRKKAIANMVRTMKRLSIDSEDITMYKVLNPSSLKVS
jgi:transposase